MDINKLAEYGEHTTIPRGIGESSDWYTLSAWPPSRDRLPRLMLAIHRMTGNAISIGLRSSGPLPMSPIRRGISRGRCSLSAIKRSVIMRPTTGHRPYCSLPMRKHAVSKAELQRVGNRRLSTPRAERTYAAQSAFTVSIEAGFSIVRKERTDTIAEPLTGVIDRLGRGDSRGSIRRRGVAEPSGCVTGRRRRDYSLDR